MAPCPLHILLLSLAGSHTSCVHQEVRALRLDRCSACQFVLRQECVRMEFHVKHDTRFFNVLEEAYGKVRHHDVQAQLIHLPSNIEYWDNVDVDKLAPAEGLLPTVTSYNILPATYTRKLLCLLVSASVYLVLRHPHPPTHTLPHQPTNPPTRCHTNPPTHPHFARQPASQPSSAVPNAHLCLPCAPMAGQGAPVSPFAPTAEAPVSRLAASSFPLCLAPVHFAEASRRAPPPPPWRAPILPGDGLCSPHATPWHAPFHPRLIHPFHIVQIDCPNPSPR